MLYRNLIELKVTISGLQKYPKRILLYSIKDAYDNGEIDYNWITDYFGGNVSEFVNKTRGC